MAAVPKERVYGFAELNRRLWRLPGAAGGGGGGGAADWAAVRGALPEAPEERSGVVARYLLSWLGPYIELAWRERLEEAYMPPPQRAHRAVCCGAQLSRAFREEEVRCGRDAWAARVEAALPGAAAGAEAAACGGARAAGCGGARVGAANALARVGFRGEPGVRGRLRWVGYVRASDTPHTLVCGVEWDADSALPAYRVQLAAAGGAGAGDGDGDEADAGSGSGAVHDGCVHGERLFHQVQRGAPRCTCEYVGDVVLLTASGDVATDGPAAPHAPSLMWALFRTFRGDLLSIVGPACVTTMCSVSAPLLLQQFVLFLEAKKGSDAFTTGLLYCFLFAAVKLAQPAAANKFVHRSARVAALFRTSTLSLLFEKSLTVSPDALARPDMSAGRILTMASSDVESIQNFPVLAMYLVTSPVMLAVYVTFLFSLLGWSALAAVVVFLLSAPLQGSAAGWISGLQGRLYAATDQRLSRTNELFSGIRVVKAMGWEKFIAAIEDDARKQELGFRRRLQYFVFVLWGIISATPSFMIAAVLAVYVLTGHVLDPSVVIPVISIVSGVTFPIMMLPQAFTSLVKFVVSTRRVTQFLECEDSHIAVEAAEPAASAGGDGSGEGAAAAALEDATVLASVPVALPACEPRARGVCGAVERVLRAVARRGVPVELQWRRAAVSGGSGGGGAPAAGAAAGSGAEGGACGGAAGDGDGEGEGGGDALYAMEDRAVLRGVCVSLPRGQLTVVVGATGSGKSVLLCALLGALRFEGRVRGARSVAYVPQQPWIMQATVEANITFFEGDRRGAGGDDAEGGAGAPAWSPLRSGGAAGVLRGAEGDDDVGGEGGEGAGELMTAEEKAEGHIPWAVYREYAALCGGAVPLGIVVTLCWGATVVNRASMMFLTFWSAGATFGGMSNGGDLGVYLTLLTSGELLMMLNDFLFVGFTLDAARRLHASLFYTVTSATTTFFDRTPLGRIINRFSKDIYVLDDELPNNISLFLGISGSVLTSISVALYTSPMSVFAVLIAGYVFFRLLRFYATVVREVRRRGSVVQSPLFSLLEEVVHGRATIAAYDKSHALFAEALRRLDLVYSCRYVEKTTTIWVAIRIEYVAALLIVSVIALGVIEKLSGGTEQMPEARVALISLSLTMFLDMSWALSGLLNFSAVVEASMNSVQRVCHYIECVPQEALLLSAPGAGGGGGAGGARDVTVVGGCCGVDAVPRRGDAEFGALRLEGVDLRYRPGLPLVLRDVCFAVAPGQKVGVVGRTGSGESTLLLAFLRLVEVCGGRMLVCGRDAREYTLPALRRLFSMIPQDPVLFEGTVRSNVDPFGDATDAAVRGALPSVGLAGPGGGGVPALDAVVQEGGSNFSVGQRQLLCLARALLKRGSAFLLMDEATANVDARLDQTVQRVVAEQFAAYTVVTIAHRLHTVAAYDVVLVMAGGRVVEMGSPRALVERRGSVFHGMVAQSAAARAAGGAGGGADGGGGREGAETAAGCAADRERREEAAVAAFLRQCK